MLFDKIDTLNMFIDFYLYHKIITNPLLLPLNLFNPSKR
ncbi:hypothetical protein JCM19274_5588 [Algibacter lectus]|uniref:Uncharacterized protein n=1 Tax=Algibacter lectus TaxID=221126 RepID=A0A090WLD1_9FLAO|nr:hypothetical protein JCM19274_5588 [Algibacter lectus]